MLALQNRWWSICAGARRLTSWFAPTSPDHDLTLLIAQLCIKGEIALRPHRLLATSCAVRLRELIGAAGR